MNNELILYNSDEGRTKVQLRAAVVTESWTVSSAPLLLQVDHSIKANS